MRNQYMGVASHLLSRLVYVYVCTHEDHALKLNSASWFQSQCKDNLQYFLTKLYSLDVSCGFCSFHYSWNDFSTISFCCGILRLSNTDGNQRIIGWCKIYLNPMTAQQCHLVLHIPNTRVILSNMEKLLQFPICFYSFAGFLPSTVTSFVESSRSLCLWSSELLKRGRSSGDQWQRSGNVLVASQGQNKWVLLGRMVHVFESKRDVRNRWYFTYETYEATMKLRDHEAIHVFQVFFRWVGSTTNYLCIFYCASTSFCWLSSGDCSRGWCLCMLVHAYRDEKETLFLDGKQTRARQFEGDSEVKFDDDIWWYMMINKEQYHTCITWITLNWTTCN